MPVIMSDCLLCKNFTKIYKKHLSSPPKCFCLAYPEGISIDILNKDKEEGQICNNGIGYIEEKSEYAREK